MVDQARRAVDTSYMTEAMVADRCMRMYRNNQWVKLHDFCAREPRARAWMLGRIARMHHAAASDPRVVELYDRLAQGLTPRARIERVVPGQAARPEDLVEIVEEVGDDMVEESAPAVPPAVAAPTALPEGFVVARDEGDFLAAGRALLDFARTVPAGAPFPMMAVEFREVAAEVAREGDLRLLAELCVAVPQRVAASAVLDLGKKLRMGAILHGPVLRLRDALGTQRKGDAVKKREAELLQAARQAMVEAD